MPDAAPHLSNADALRVLIVDDEPLARQRIRELLADKPATIVGEAADGPDAVEAIQSLDPDLVFLDVQMPGLNGIGVVEQVGVEHMPVTIFVTAYDRYALKAFDVAAVDYLMKPFDDERFERAWTRGRSRVGNRSLDTLSQELSRLLRTSDHPQRIAPEADAPSEPDEADDGTANEGAPGGGPPYLERIAVQGRGHVRVVPVNQITHLTADGSYVELHTGEDTYLIRERMKTLESRLNPDEFVRVHRSVIVRLDQVELILRSGGGDYAVRLKDGTRLSVSRTRVDLLQQRLGINDVQDGAGSA